jgi:5-methylcytosine-specific restriction protein A
MVSGRWADSTRRARLPANWPDLVRQVKARDRGICYLCERDGADTVDHIVPGDDHSLTNLAAVHDRNPPHCHRTKSGREGAAARKARGGYRPTRRAAEQHPGLVRPTSGTGGGPPPGPEVGTRLAHEP